MRDMGSRRCRSCAHPPFVILERLTPPLPILLVVLGEDPATDLRLGSMQRSAAFRGAHERLTLRAVEFLHWPPTIAAQQTIKHALVGMSDHGWSHDAAGT